MGSPRTLKALGDCSQARPAAATAGLSPRAHRLNRVAIYTRPQERDRDAWMQLSAAIWCSPAEQPDAAVSAQCSTHRLCPPPMTPHRAADLEGTWSATTISHREQQPYRGEPFGRDRDAAVPDAALGHYTSAVPSTLPVQQGTQPAQPALQRPAPSSTVAALLANLHSGHEWAAPALECSGDRKQPGTSGTPQRSPSIRHDGKMSVPPARPSSKHFPGVMRAGVRAVKAALLDLMHKS